MSYNTEKSFFEDKNENLQDLVSEYENEHKKEENSGEGLLNGVKIDTETNLCDVIREDNKKRKLLNDFKDAFCDSFYRFIEFLGKDGAITKETFKNEIINNKEFSDINFVERKEPDRDELSIIKRLLTLNLDQKNLIQQFLKKNVDVVSASRGYSYDYIVPLSNFAEKKELKDKLEMYYNLIKVMDENDKKSFQECILERYDKSFLFVYPSIVRNWDKNWNPRLKDSLEFNNWQNILDPKTKTELQETIEYLLGIIDTMKNNPESQFVFYCEGNGDYTKIHETWYKYRDVLKEIFDNIIHEKGYDSVQFRPPQFVILDSEEGLDNHLKKNHRHCDSFKKNNIINVKRIHHQII